MMMWLAAFTTLISVYCAAVSYWHACAHAKLLVENQRLLRELRRKREQLVSGVPRLFNGEGEVEDHHMRSDVMEKYGCTREEAEEYIVACIHERGMRYLCIPTDLWGVGEQRR